MPVHQPTPVRASSLNIYQRRFEFSPQLSHFPFLFLLYPQIIETSITGADEAMHDLLTTDVNYVDLNDSASQDDFLLTYPLQSPTSSSLLSAYTPSSLSISPSHYGQSKDQRSKHDYLVVGDPRDRDNQCGEDVTNSPR
jgi:hypothetical protein